MLLVQVSKTTMKSIGYLATLWEATVGIDDKEGTEQWEREAKQHVESNNLQGWMVETTEDQIAKLKELLKPSPLDRISG